jgi:hypothetical protein
MKIIISNCIVSGNFGCGANTNLRIVEYPQGRAHFCPVCGEECLATQVGRKNSDFTVKNLGLEQWEISDFSAFAEAWGMTNWGN